MTRRLLTEMIGPEPVGDLFAQVDTTGASATMRPTAPLRAVPADAWRRVAALDALDRWLQERLDSALIDAERAVARIDAAGLLGDDPARRGVLHEATTLARGACYGVAQYLQRLPHSSPDPLRAGLRRLVEGYRWLADREPDADDLDSVVRAGQRALETSTHRRSAPRSIDEPTHRVRRFSATWTSAIDPRQLPARVVKLSDHPTVGEVAARQTVVHGVDVLEVEVPAFATLTEFTTAWSAAERLIARFVDRRTGTVHARQALAVESRPNATGKGYVFRTRLPLDDLDPARLRVDVVDAAIHLPPVRDDADPRLLEARHDMVALRNARAAAADRELGHGVPRRGVAEGGSSDDPVETAGVARPMVAELALAHELASGPEL